MDTTKWFWVESCSCCWHWTCWSRWACPPDHWTWQECRTFYTGRRGPEYSHWVQTTTSTLTTDTDWWSAPPSPWLGSSWCHEILLLPMILSILGWVILTQILSQNSLQSDTPHLISQILVVQSQHLINIFYLRSPLKRLTVTTTEPSSQKISRFNRRNPRNAPGLSRRLLTGHMTDI